ncbi:hypothetical protein T265_08552 [Opisthorchis viverrini]|uniref:Uncharacterized protein n=1 Tax=Opisthorchis viverrini TaxID=6198 RepID=A0A074ZD27_OPIVI|nr:hypothetical protein T265_08552 [Opisthorchis viverrini]KER23557.1 hypothetical protein T265_08552 [Opisthorchis viverrini]
MDTLNTCLFGREAFQIPDSPPVRETVLVMCFIRLKREAELRRLQVCDFRCLKTTDSTGCCRRIRSGEIRKPLFGCAAGDSVEEFVQHQKLRWLGHVLCMSKRMLFSRPH